MMSVEDIVSITNASITGNACGDICVRYLLTDSRQLQTATDTLFVALRTAKNDGHKYIPSLYAKGVRLFLVQQDVPEMAAMSEAIFIKVENTLTALQQIAAAHRKLFDIPVLAITGSNGKTIVKEWISSMLRVDKKVVSSPKSYNSQIGVPLSVWQMKEGDEFAVFEAGISEPDEMSALQKIINPTVGIFTNVGTAHDEYFANEAQKTAEKLKLFTNVSQLIYCADYPQIREQLQLHLPSLRTLSWAMRKDVEADIKILSIDIREGVSLVTAAFGEQTIFGSCQLKVELPFTDGASIENAIHCWIFMLSQGYKDYGKSLKTQRSMLRLSEGRGKTCFDYAEREQLHCEAITRTSAEMRERTEVRDRVSSEVQRRDLRNLEISSEIAKRIKRLQTIEMRMEMKEGINRCFIINDFYNSDYNSFLIALDFLANQHQNKFRRIILSDILQSGRSDKDLYKDVADALKKKGIDAIIGIGEGISKEQASFSSLQSKFFPDTESFLQQAKAEWFNNETILLKGARSFGFERVSRFFQKKVHQTVFEINLDAIVHNLNIFRSMIKPSTKIMLMTKAFSYGSGSYEIAHALQYHNADYLAVAYTDEGIQLRQNGVATPIMVMNPEEQGLDSVLQYDLEPQIYSMEMLQELLEKPISTAGVKIGYSAITSNTSSRQSHKSCFDTHTPCNGRRAAERQIHTCTA